MVKNLSSHYFFFLILFKSPIFERCFSDLLIYFGPATRPAEPDFPVFTSVLSRVQLFATPQTVAHQAPLSMEFPRQEYWSGLPPPSPMDLSDPGMELTTPVLARRILYHSAIWQARPGSNLQALQWKSRVLTSLWLRTGKSLKFHIFTPFLLGF